MAYCCLKWPLSLLGSLSSHNIDDAIFENELSHDGKKREKRTTRLIIILFNAVDNKE